MITVELDAAELDRVLRQLAVGLSDMSDLMNDLGNYMLVAHQDRVQRGEQPDGQPFALRSETTIDRYIADDLPFGQPLNQSGTMRQQMAYNYGSDYVAMGSNAIQAAVMHFGAEKGSLGSGAPWGDIPARPFIGLSDQDESEMMGVSIEWLDGLAS
ncbi:phage virion morphogenesis protein [Cognatiyoonia sp. IB215182]|uniref:phage virion morphogenesis protein n=1 Tax=Cognatiyoonia sp. IB215182 TaxID=3097353 RepID=UPI002A0BD5F2|nr:phage virion morphogenesis protein [Cognatiyoonia sp. IB215182]MDX8354345.1 phage virion morphogenesis protein [Cognatiyoonia sp. IB215182]